MAKTRVHELAKTYGIESKEVLEKLKEMGEFVKSPSSTIELPVEMKFKKQYGDALLASKPTADVAEKPASAPAEAKPAAKSAPAEPAAAPAAEAPAAAPVEAPAAKAAPPKPGPRSATPEAPAASAAAPEAPAADPTTGTGDGDAAANGTGARPSSPAPRPVGRPGAPRPGNNPFASSQGMGRRPAPGTRA